MAVTVIKERELAIGGLLLQRHAILQDITGTRAIVIEIAPPCVLHLWEIHLRVLGGYAIFGRVMNAIKL